jgi:ParB family chromosome partitioning protein
MERKALGKGIGALIPEKESLAEDRVTLLPTEQIKPNPFQPRKNFAVEQMENLIQSVKEKGIIQPVLVRKAGEFYELIAGERRLRAANMLKLKEIPAIIKDTQDRDSLEISLIENIQREELNPIEEAHAYQYLINKFSVTQERIGEVLGKSRASIANILRILKLPQEIQEEIKNGRISFAHGRALLEIADANTQRLLAQDIIAKGLSVRELENLIKARRPKALRHGKVSGARDPATAFLEGELQHVLATKVRINKHNKCGQIIIEFYSPEDLSRIANILKGERAK